MRPLVVLVRGHSPGGGASAPPWGEYDSIPEYMIGAEMRLRAEGVDVIRLELGSLVDRQNRGLQAIELHRHRFPNAPCVYVSCHLNIAAGPYQKTVLFSDGRSALGLQVAQKVSSAISEAYEWPVKLRTAAPTEGAPARVFECIGRIYKSSPPNCCAILVELLSLDQEPISVSLLRRGGMQLGAGLAAHLKGST